MLSRDSSHAPQLSLKQVRKGEADATVQVLPQSRRVAGCPRGASLSIPIVLPLSSEARSPTTEAAPVPLTRSYPPDAGSHLSHPNIESTSRSVTPDHFNNSIPVKVTTQPPPALLTLASLFIVSRCLIFSSFSSLTSRRLNSSRAKQVRATVCVGDALEGEGEES